MDLQSALSALASDFTTRALHSPRHKGLLVGLANQVSALVTQAQALEADNNDTVLVAQLRHVSEFLQDLNTFTVLDNSRNLFFCIHSVEITRIALKNGHIPSQSSVRSVSSTTRSSNAAPHFPATGAVSSERQSSLSPVSSRTAADSRVAVGSGWASPRFQNSAVSGVGRDQIINTNNFTISGGVHFHNGHG
ncbi:hypothetical protein D9758_017786 [Tetrapyrgos nigripes]|uniref:Uncharacterized protein n=1 Tax=Tetrapyrgos nigripes TaxID=182062 RepID=A0A8H5F8U8_9AGAR|nr:hypothetical protein D9758_017786 [Tetrapyrgos nigripes]